MIKDEIEFATNRTVNTQNIRQYTSKGHPPNFTFEWNNSRQKLTVWGGVCGNGVVLSPSLFDGNLNGNGYLRLLNE